MKTFLCIMLCLGFSVQVTAQSRDESKWKDWQFLIGKWTAEGGGQPGQAKAGGFSFELDLQGSVLVRRNYSEYAATASKPASRHDDLMVIYQEPGRGTRADYYDNEGHIIRYTVTISEDKKSITFLSDPVATAPTFRLIYRRSSADTVSMEFDIAPPGKPDSFSKYVEGTAKRR